MIYISCISVIIFHFMIFRNRGLVDPVSVFFIAYLYYSYFTPITMLTFNQFDIYLLDQWSWVSADMINKSAVISFLGYVGYIFGYFFLSRGTNFGDYRSENKSFPNLFRDTYIRIMISFVIIFIIIISTFFRESFIQATSSYSSKISGNYINSNYSFLFSVILTLFSLISNYIILNSKNYIVSSVICSGFFMTLAVITFSKGPYIFAALCIFCFLYRFKRVPAWAALSSIAVVAVVASVYIIPAFSVFRATGEFMIVSSDQTPLNRVFSEASGPFSVVNYATQGYIDATAHPLWESFVLWLPRAIWAERPLDIAESFARQIIVGWQAGQGMGFSPLAEGYVRYGLLGTAFFMALLGAVNASIQSFAARAVPDAMRVPAILTVGGLVSVVLLRGAFSSLITQSLQIWVPIIVMSLIARQLVSRLES